MDLQMQAAENGTLPAIADVR